MSTDLVARIRHSVAAELASVRERQRTAGRELDSDDEQMAARSLIADALRQRAEGELRAGRAKPAAENDDAVAQAVYDELFGMGRLDRLLANERVENINVNGYDRVFVEHADGWKEQVAPFVDSDTELEELLRRMASKAGKRFDTAHPQLDLTLPDGSRLSATMRVSTRPSVSIRRHRHRKLDLDDIVQMGVIGQGLRAFLHAAVLARRNIVVAGGMRAGKTTMLRALASAIPAYERLATVEDVPELFLDLDEAAHPDVVSYVECEPNVEGFGAVSMAELVRRALRSDFRRIILGEARAAEIRDVLTAMSVGAPGSLSSVHADSADGALARIATMLGEHHGIPLPHANQMIADAVHLVVFIESRPDPAALAAGDLGGPVPLLRYVSQVCEVREALPDGQLKRNELFVPGRDGRAVPATSPSAELLERLEAYGYQRTWFRGGGAP